MKRRGTGSSSPLHRLAAELHQQPDGGRSRVELGDVIFVHNLPHAAHIGVGGQTLELKHTQHFKDPQDEFSASTSPNETGSEWLTRTLVAPLASGP